MFLYVTVVPYSCNCVLTVITYLVQMVPEDAALVLNESGPGRAAAVEPSMSEDIANQIQQVQNLDKNFCMNSFNGAITGMQKDEVELAANS